MPIAATNIPPRAGTRGMPHPARYCQASAQCPIQTGIEMKMIVMSVTHTASTAMASGCRLSGATP